MLTSSSQLPVTRVELSSWLVSCCGSHRTRDTFRDMNFPVPTVILKPHLGYYLKQLIVIVVIVECVV